MTVFLTGKRNGYTPKQCGRTLTVRELIDVLEGFDDDAKVYLNNDNGYSYGSIVESDLTDESEEDDDDSN